MAGLPEAERVAQALGLRPLPGEGGLYRRTWAGPPLPGGRAAGSAIYYMLAGDAFSHLHRLDADEVYHFYAGDPVEMLVLGRGAPAAGLAPQGTEQPAPAAGEASCEGAPAGGSARRVILGPDVLAGQTPQLVVPAGAWQGSRLAGSGVWALMGTTMAPGYTDAGYTQGQRADLLRQWPAWRELIVALTRG